jgi:hypothetical protein
LHEYMINKDNKEYKNWLNNLKKFVQAWSWFRKVILFVELHQMLQYTLCLGYLFMHYLCSSSK